MTSVSGQPIIHTQLRPSSTTAAAEGVLSASNLFGHQAITFSQRSVWILLPILLCDPELVSVIFHYVCKSWGPKKHMVFSPARFIEIYSEVWKCRCPCSKWEMQSLTKHNASCLERVAEHTGVVRWQPIWMSWVPPSAPARWVQSLTKVNNTMKCTGADRALGFSAQYLNFELEEADLSKHSSSASTFQSMGM